MKRAAAALLLLAGCSPAPLPAASPSPAPAPARNGEAASRAAFLSIYPVFTSPRCVNCHNETDGPLMGDHGEAHEPIVVRGGDGRGRYSSKCASCHQETNLAGRHMPPGRPLWMMPPSNATMPFRGRSPAELARQILDRRRNNGKSLEELVTHVDTDELVEWAWDPGEGRTKAPLSHAEFIARFREWIETGAAIPE